MAPMRMCPECNGAGGHVTTDREACALGPVTVVTICGRCEGAGRVPDYARTMASMQVPETTMADG